MSRKVLSVKRLVHVCAMVVAMTATAFGKDVIAQIPVTVTNTNAVVTLSPPAGSTIERGDSKTLIKGVQTVLDIWVDVAKSSVLHRSHGNAYAPAVARYGNGTVSIQLSAQQYSNAAVTLYSVNGKRVLSGKAAATNGSFNISRANVASGVYMLSVKGVDGNSYSTRLTHSGGRLNINATFGGGDVQSLGKDALSKSMSSSGTWRLTVTATGYVTQVEMLTPHLGMNDLVEITLEGGNSIVDNRDKKTYKVVTIGTQTWFAENLNYAGTSGNVGVCYGNRPDSCAKYGRLYRWVEAMSIDASYENTSWPGNDANHQGICPSGWRIPSSSDWDDLISAVGGLLGSGTVLKSAAGWYDGDERYIPGTDDFDFSALPGGYGWSGTFSDAGGSGNWWSATEDDATNALKFLTRYSYNFMFQYWNTKNYAYSVRCLMD